MTWISMLIGLVLGIFLALGSALILGRAMVILQAKNDPKNFNWSMGQAAGLASLWTSKLVAVGIVLFYTIRAGYSPLFIGIFLPIGIIAGVYIARSIRRESPKNIS